MKNTIKIIGIIVMVAVIGFTMTSCTTTTIGGAHSSHGLISGLFEPKALTDDAQKIESYFVVLSLIDIGFPEFAKKVKAADKAGKKITLVQMDFWGLICIVTAYAAK